MDFTDLHIWSPSDLKVSYCAAKKDGEADLDVIGVTICGAYPEGSLGNGHAHWISQKVIEAYMAFDPITIVIDFRGMTYTWGNTLLKLFEDYQQMTGDSPHPRIVVSSLCEPALRSLLGDSRNKYLHHSLTEAFEAAQRDVREWLDTP